MTSSKQISHLAPGHGIVAGPKADRHTIVAVVAPGAEIIFPEMPHAVGQQVLELHLGNIFEKILLKDGFAVFEVPALKWFGIDKMGQHIFSS